MFAKAFLLLLCGGFACQAFSQPITWIQGARTASLANADAALEDPWNTIGNPAGIAGCKAPAISVSIQRRFLVKELDSRAAAAVLPLERHPAGQGSQVLGLNVNFFGSSLYSEQQVSLAYARAFSSRFRTGFRISYHGIKLPRYTSQQAWSVTIGIQFSPAPGLWLGAAVFNPGKAEFDDELHADIPLTLSAGATYAFSKKVLSALEVEHISGFPPALRAAFEYALHSSLAIRAGVATAPFRQYGGLGIRLKDFALDLSASTHLQLGFTPQITLSYEF